MFELRDLKIIEVKEEEEEEEEEEVSLNELNSSLLENHLRVLMLLNNF